jgi:hypothetical protein
MSHVITVQGILGWPREVCICIMHSITVVSGTLSPQHGMSSVCGWSIMKDCHIHTEQTIVDSRHRVVCKLGSWARGVTTPHRTNRAFYEMLKCYSMLAPYTFSIIPHSVYHSVQQTLVKSACSWWLDLRVVSVLIFILFSTANTVL